MRPTGRELVLTVLALMLAQSGAAERPQARELLQRAETAAAAGRLEQAESIICTEATRDPKNREVQEKCNHYRQLAQAQRDADHKHVKDGAAYLAMKNIDAAEKEFQAIKSPSYSAVKKEWLDKIAAARAKAQQEQQKKEQEQKLAEEAAQQQRAEADRVLKAQLDRAVAAYEKNDFAMARKLLAAVTGTYQDQAQQYLASINQYDRAIREGASLEKSGNYTQALAAYRRAAAVKSNPPQKVKDRLAKLEQILAKQPSASQQAQAATPVPPPQDEVLRAAIEEYYRGNYSQAETQLAAYAGTSEKLNALARFYLGASRLSRYYLAVDQAEKGKLWQTALADLQLAKRTQDFSPPRSSVSPKIMEVYDKAVP